MSNIKTPKSLMYLVENLLLTSSSMVGKPQTQYNRRYLKTVPAPKKNKSHDRILRHATRQQAIYQRMSWRDYQRSLNRAKNNQRRIRRILISIFLLTLTIGTVYTAISLLSKDGLTPTSVQIEKLPIIDHLSSDSPTPSMPPDRTAIKQLVNGGELLNLTENSLNLSHDGLQYRLETSLYPSLQSALIDSFDKENSRYIGIVAMAPDTGRILAFAGFNKTEENINPCTTNKFPAASIFKIVTTAAVAEKFGYTGDTVMKFNGYKHTLYKSQLKENNNRYTNRISLRNSFAQSINPVFGKIGSLRLGKEALDKYGKLFGFNRKFNSELDIFPSNLQIDEDPYHHAEIASGFNRDTTISPVHAAMIVSAVLNGGKLVEPTIIDRILDVDGTVIYNGSKTISKPIINSRTSSIIHGMMETTVKSGTARKAFSGYTRNKILRRLTIGGKTGSIYNKAHDARFDWFAGFAKTKDQSKQIVISVVVAHEKYIGRRAGEYARSAFQTYFEDYFSKKEATQQSEEKS